MNKLRLHASVLPIGWSHADAEHAISNTAKPGYEIIQAPALDPESIDVPDTRKRLEKYAVNITFSLGLDVATDISDGDPDMARAARDHANGPWRSPGKTWRANKSASARCG